MARTYLVPRCGPRTTTAAAQPERRTAAAGSTRRRRATTGVGPCGPSASRRTGRPTASSRQARRAGAARAMLARSPPPAGDGLRGARRAAAARGRARRLRREAPAARRPTGPADARPPPPPWAWPYDRLTYANAVLPEAMIAVGDAPARRPTCGATVWPCSAGSRTSRPSTATSPWSLWAGRGRASRGRRFDQQPIEVAALAEAARTALRGHQGRAMGHAPGTLQGLVRRRQRLPAAAAGPRDGRRPATVWSDGSLNRNQGAESTLAWLATAQLAGELDPVGAS